MRRSWLRRIVLFGAIPLLVVWIGYHSIRHIRTFLASRTPGLSPMSIDFEGRRYRYALIEPVGARFEGARPLVVFLHSATECGSDGILPASKVPTAFLEYAREQAGAVVLLPQFPRHDQGWNVGWHPLVLELIERTRQDRLIDERRITLVGMSMGGQGCWHLAAERPELFAAVVPICGNGSPARLAPALTAVPVWAFHGSADGVIPVEGSRALVAALRQAGGTKVTYTEYDGEGHRCWDRALTDPQLLEWLFQRRRDADADKQPQ